MRAYRSPAKLFAFGIIGLILIVASVDVMFTHWLSEPPEANDGVLTTRGHAQQRGDILWGGVMAGVGVLLMGGAVVELVRRKPQVEVGTDGLMLAVGSHESDVHIAWSDIRSVTSESATDEYDGGVRPYLIVDVIDAGGLPPDPIGAVWMGTELHVDASLWAGRVTDIALSSQGALAHHRRLEEIKTMEAPSITWDSEEPVVELEPTAEVKAVGVLDEPPEEPVDTSTREPSEEDE